MAEKRQIENLIGKIEQLLEAIDSRQEPAVEEDEDEMMMEDITAEDIKSYRKVRDFLSRRDGLRRRRLGRLRR